MPFRGLSLLAAMSLLTACGAPSGRQGTDIVVTGTGPTGQVLGGENAVFNMTVSNTGQYDASNVKIVDNVGNQLKLISITCTASGGATCPNPTSVQMVVPTFPAGGTLAFKVTLQLSQGGTGTVVNTMIASFPLDSNTSNNSITVEATAFSPVTNIVVSGSGPSGTLTGGQAATFAMTVTNNGPDAATSFNVFDNPGSGLSLTGITCAGSGGAKCPATVGVVTPIDTLPAGGTLTFSVDTLVGPNVNGTVANQLSVDVTTNPNHAANNFYATATVVTQQAGLLVTGTGPAGTLAAGDTAVFTMVVTNSGPNPATTVNIVDVVGNNLTFQSATCASNGGAACPNPVGPVMSVPSIPVGGSLTFTVNALVAPGTNGTVTNTMTAKAANDVTNTQHSATATATVSSPHASLVVSGTGPAQPVPGGGTAVFAMSVVNSGPDPATNLKLVNTVSGNQTFAGATCTASGGAACPAAVGIVTSVGTLPVGGEIVINVSATVDANTNGAITDTMQATADNSFSVGGNSAVAIGQAFSAVGNVSISGVGPSSVASGGPANFAMTVANAGPDVVSSIQLVDAVGGNLTLQSVSCSAAGGATCPAALGPQMTVTNLPVNGSLVFNVATTVAAGTQGSIINTMDATVTGGVVSHVTGVAVGSAYSADLSVAGTPPPGPLPGGATAAFTMVVMNNGPGTSQNVNITNAFSAGITGAGAIVCSATGGATCPAALGSSMTVPTLPANGVLSFTVPFTITVGTNGPVSDTMTVTAAGDNRPGNDSDTATVVSASADLGVSETGSPQVNAGSNAVFTATVANGSQTDASNVTITYSLTGPAGNSAAIACTPSTGATCPAVLGSTMTVPTLSAGRYLIFTFTVPVPSAAAGQGAITNTVTVASAGDPNPANNQASYATIPISPQNGTYQLYAADGNQYSMTIDFDAQTYTITGNGQNIQAAFTADAAGGGFTVTGVKRFRVGPDLIVGGEDFGGGVIPYLAARVFGTTITQLAGIFGGLYDLVTLNVPAVGPVVTHAGTARVSGNVLQICQADNQVATPQTCTSLPAGSLHSYAVTVSGSVYTGVDTVTGQPYSFQMAQIGATSALLSAGTAPDGSLQLRIGLPDASALAGGTSEGASTIHDWITMQLQPTSYSFTSQLGNSDSAPLSTTAPSGGPFSMLVGDRASDGAQIFVMQSYPVAIAFGGFGGAASGLLQVTIP
jgi:uncharacterized repeat protein (TIGR01451 family)